MSVTITENMTGQFKSIEIKNKYIRAVILPELGGRVWELEDIQRGRQWIWHREDVSLQVLPVGSIYEDVWAGGWEELFPNDAAGKFEGRDLPDHGEWWTMSWHVEITVKETVAMVRLTAKSNVIKTYCVKEICLTKDATEISINYSIKSEEKESFHFLFKQHLAVNITQDCQLWLPGGYVRGVDPSFSTILPDAKTYKWPIASGKDPMDLRIIPSIYSKKKEFIYLWDVFQSWCGIIDNHKKSSIRMKYDSEKFPYVWLFLTYGGWRNLYTTVLEPCTNMPKDLSEAVSLNQSARLEPGQEFKTTVSVALDGLEKIPK